MAADTRALIDDADIVHAHIFPYSERAGTPAARMPQVPVAVRKARAEALRDAAARRRAQLAVKKISSKAGSGDAENGPDPLAISRHMHALLQSLEQHAPPLFLAG